MIGLSLQTHTKCAKCLSEVPLNALAEVYHCTSCSQAINVPAAQWQEVLSGPLFALAFDEGRKEASGSSPEDENRSSSQQEIFYSIRREAPAFPESNTPIDRAAAAAAAAAPEGRLLAPDTGAPCSVREVPDSFHEVLPAIQLLVAESVDQLPGASDGAALATSSVSSPIVFQCPQCAGGLSVDGTSRTVHCSFCNSEAYLPDDLWQRLHPAPEVTRWFVWLDPARLRLNWGMFFNAHSDDDGNLYLRCRSTALDDNLVLASLTPDLSVRWLSINNKLADTLDTCMGPGDKLLVWSSDRDGVSVFSTRDRSLSVKIGGRTGNQPKDGEKFSVKGAEWVVLDRDETLLVYRRREVKWGHELTRYDLEGNRLPCWQGEGKVGGWLERTFGSDGRKFSQLKHRWFRCMDRINKAKPGPDGSILFLEEGHNWFHLGRYTRDGQKQFIVYHDHHAHDFCGDAEGNAYVMLADWSDENKIPYPGGLGSIFRYYILRIGSDGTSPTVLAKSVIDGGPITFEDRVVVAKDGTVHAFGDQDKHLQFAPDGTVLHVSEGSKKKADELRKILEEYDG